MHRLTFSQTVNLSVGIDLNDEVAEKLKLRTDDINRFLGDRRGQIIEEAQKAAGRKIVELLQAYAEEFVVPVSNAYEMLGPAAIAEAKQRWDELNQESSKPAELGREEPKS
jgi:hypothetical protein